MRIKLDENITIDAIPLLVERGHEVETVPSEGLKGANDGTVMAACATEDRMLLTFDAGFGDVRAYPPGTHPGVVLLRLVDQRPERVLDALGRFLDEDTLDELTGCLVVVSDDRIRIRRPGIG